MKTKTKKNLIGDFCDLCKKRKEGYTFIELDEKHELALCQDCRRLVLTKLFGQYMLEADMQGLCNELLSDRIDNLKDLVLEDNKLVNQFKNSLEDLKAGRINKKNESRKA